VETVTVNADLTHLTAFAPPTKSPWRLSRCRGKRPRHRWTRPAKENSVLKSCCWPCC